MDDNSSSPDNGSRPRSISYLSTLFRRTASISESWTPQSSAQDSGGNQRRFSESSLSETDSSEVPSILTLDDDAVADDDSLLPETTRSTHRRLYRSETLPVDGDGNQTAYDQLGHNRPRANSLTALLHSSEGAQQSATVLGSSSSGIKENDSHESGIFQSSNRDISGGGVDTVTRETSQTDHINKRLLESFLTRINNVAATFISGTDNPSVQSAPGVYTDDALMDHILRRVESPHEKK